MAAAVMLHAGCGECDVACPDPEELAAPPAANVSNPVLNVPSAAATTTGSTALASAGDEAVFVSLAPDSFPNGEVAVLRNPRTGATVTSAMANGGLEAVPVAASAGDTVIIEVKRRSGEPVAQRALAVPDIRKPRVVRVYPPHKKRDVVLNARPVIFFTEPVAAGSLTPTSVQLFRGSSPVPGTVRRLDGTGAMVAFVPAAALAANTEYRLVVTDAVQDLDGDALVQRASVDFTTGQSSAGPPAVLRLSPSDTVRMTTATYQMTATVEDAVGNILIDQPVTWSTSEPGGLAVSTTGLLTALAEGGYSVTARVGELAASVLVFVTFPDLAAEVRVSPSTATVAAGDTVILTATVHGASGRTLNREVTWASSAPAVAILETSGSGSRIATVTGVSQGRVTITATSGPASATATITVTPPQPVASVTVTPASITIVVQGAVRFDVTLRDANGRLLSSRPITWRSDNAAVVSVTEGYARAIGQGSAAVMATSEGVSDTAAITVITTVRFGSVSAGGNHSCGLTTNGAAFCWGDGGGGQLGNGSTGSSPAPVAVAGGLTFAALSTGGGHTCGLTNSGAAYCWGLGLLGNGSTTRAYSPVPVPVAGGLTFRTVSAGLGYTCGVTTTEAYCWGFNSSGRLGNGSEEEHSPVPGPVSGGLTFTAISAGHHTCGLTTTGAAYCWGVGGALGNDAAGRYSAVPVPVTGGLTFTSLSVGSWYHTCALTASGAAYCWGYNQYGKLGIGSELPYSSSVPVPVVGGLTFTALSAGDSHTCGLTTSGAAYCWGYNRTGQLGVGTTAGPDACEGMNNPCSLRPAAVIGGVTFTTVSAAPSHAGNSHTCGFVTNGVAYCWGSGWYGQLGNGTWNDSSVPVRVAGQP